MYICEYTALGLVPRNSYECIRIFLFLDIVLPIGKTIQCPIFFYIFPLSLLFLDQNDAYALIRVGQKLDDFILGIDEGDQS